MPWQVLEHTADVGLVSRGESLEEAIGDLVVGFGHLVCPEGEVQARGTEVLEVEAADLEDLVIDALDELNFLHQMEGFIPATCQVTILETADGVRGTFEMAGEPWDEKRHGHLMEIKATTFHELTVATEPASVRVIFDI